jgi:hypothetical protein
LKTLFETWLDKLLALYGLTQPPPAPLRLPASEITTQEIRYAGVFGAFCLLPHALIFYFSTGPITESLAKLFAAPVHLFITGMLMSALVYLGTHFLKSPSTFGRALRLTLIIMSAQPFLGLLSAVKVGAALVLIAYGALVSIGVSRAYNIPIRSCGLFFGSTYGVFAIFQLQASFRA